MHKNCSRREWLLRTAAAVPGAWLAASPLSRPAAAPALPVAVAKCKTYDPSELVPTLSRMFDQLGGLGRLVNGKTVGIKINLTGDPTYRLGYAPLGDSHYTHPQGASVGGERQGGHRVRQPPGGRLTAARLWRPKATQSTVLPGGRGAARHSLVLLGFGRERATQRSGVAGALETKFLRFWTGQEQDSVPSLPPSTGSFRVGALAALAVVPSLARCGSFAL